ncbi:hypothetical protein [Saccharopolyspora aridisoli]|nr:hypothetical protein [Saccharopolyspora aridisoli]
MKTQQRHPKVIPTLRELSGGGTYMLPSNLTDHQNTDATDPVRHIQRSAT